MGDKQHSNELKHQYWIDKDISKKLDEEVKKAGYISRTEWYREQIRNFLKNN